MKIWNSCNACYIAGNPIKDINAKLTFLSSGSKVERWSTPLVLKSGGNIGSCNAWKCATNIDIHRKPHKRYQCKTYISECKIKSWKMIDPLIWLTRMSPKIFQFRFSLDMVNDDWLPPRIWYLVEMLEILLLYILCYDACKFATNLFYPSAESHLKMLIYYIFSYECRFEMAVMHLVL